MGVNGLYGELGPGNRQSLASISSTHYRTHSRRLRLAIDASIWSFQVQSSSGGQNPALRAFYYRLLRLLTLNIEPLFVFDGPQRPAFKRNRRIKHTTPLLTHQARKLLKLFGFPSHTAPGEAEAECANLQRKGVVDAVLTEDVDALMFGSGVTFKNWSPNGTRGKTPTHVSVYTLDEIQKKKKLTPEGMILIAMMSGGDYIPQGVPRCGIKTAVEAAKAGFGVDLCALEDGDDEGLREWRTRLQWELESNESGWFQKKNKGIRIPADFPDEKVLGYYKHPVVNPSVSASSFNWDGEIDVLGLREYVKDAFEWKYIHGAKKFIRTLAGPLLTWKLCQTSSEDELEKLVEAFHGRREHFSTDGEKEVRISFTPANVVNIDWDQEEVDPGKTQPPEADKDGSLEDEDAEPGAKSSKYDPFVPERIWVLDVFLRQGVKEKFEEWEKPKRRTRAAAATTAATTTRKRNAPKPVEKETQRSIRSMGRIGKAVGAVGAAEKRAEMILSVQPLPAKQDITRAPRPSKPPPEKTRTKGKTKAPPIISHALELPSRPQETLEISPPRGRRYSALGIFGAPASPEPSQQTRQSPPSPPLITKRTDKDTPPPQPPTPASSTPTASSSPPDTPPRRAVPEAFMTPNAPRDTSVLKKPSSKEAPCTPFARRGVPTTPTGSARGGYKEVEVLDLSISSDEDDDKPDVKGKRTNTVIDLSGSEKIAKFALSPNVTVRKKRGDKWNTEDACSPSRKHGEEFLAEKDLEIASVSDLKVGSGLDESEMVREMEKRVGYTPAIKNGKTTKRIVIKDTGYWMFVDDGENVEGQRVYPAGVQVVDLTEGD